VTPNISRVASRSIQFQDIYAHAPTSHKALVSILSSTYPLISYRTLTRETPDRKFDSVSAELKKHGFRTGFFYSADLRYARVGEFLSRHSFDVVKDFRSIDCDLEFDPAAPEILRRHSTDDRCTARNAADWILSGGREPSFAVVWTNMTHIPYYAAGSAVRYVSDDDELNTYLNALHRGDEALGMLLAALDTAGLADSTLVIITGDHGEAFGQHGQRGHGADVYQENVHVPLIMTNPALTQQVIGEVVGGHIDIAPTVFDVLGLPLPPTWQGHSLLAPDRPPRTYFFATWTGLKFGYREGQRKFTFDATADHCTAVDLNDDPGEIHDLSVDDVTCRNIQERLAAWMQYQQSLVESSPGDQS